MSEYVGLPDVKVILRKRSFQYIVPPSDIDMSMSDFYTEHTDPNLEADNVLFVKEMECMLVKPLYVNRSTYIVSAVAPSYRYVSSAAQANALENSEGTTVYPYRVEVPKGAEWETKEETLRRVFELKTTYAQRWGGNGTFLHAKGASTSATGSTSATIGSLGSIYDDADWVDVMGVWDEDAMGRPYSGPDFATHLHEPSTGATQPTAWIHQLNSMPNMEWFLAQKGNMFTNQPFWIEVHKDKTTPTDAEDPDGYSRYYKYGGVEVKAFFGVRIGWNSPRGGKFEDNVSCRNAGGNGPYDIIFPIGGTPFIWDHGSVKEEVKQKDLEVDDGQRVDYHGHMMDSTDGWTLPDEDTNFKLYFYYLRGKLVIASSFASSPWIVPQNFGKVSKDTADKYENFYIPPGKVCIMGRGFKFRMSFNPVEFNIYKNGKKREPSASIQSRPIQERRDYPSGDKGGLFDIAYYNNGLVGDPSDTDEFPFQNFLCVPNANEDIDLSGRQVSYSYGCDVVERQYDSSSLGGSSRSYTSMMIPIEGQDPHSISFDPASKKSVIYTKSRVPEEDDRPVPTTRVDTRCGFRAETTITAHNKIIEIGMNCQKPTKGKYNTSTSERFASPVVWRMKAKHYSPDPPRGTDIDITGLVSNISLNATASDFYTVRQSAQVEVILPKTPLLPDYYHNVGFTSREELIRLLCGGSREIEISLGWMDSNPAGPARRVVFTGISNSVPTSETYALDTVTLDCKDRLQLLEKNFFMNSPMYDGMNVSDAFMHVCTLTGFPKSLFKVVSRRAHYEILEMGYTFMKPAIRFDDGTTIFDGAKTIAEKFWHVIRTNPRGVIELVDLNVTGNREQQNLGQHAVIDELPLSDNSFQFYVDGSDSRANAFNRIYDKIDISRTFDDRITQIVLVSMDRRDFAILIDGNTVDVDAVENPDSPDFLGYQIPGYQSEAAFGTREKARYYKAAMEKHVFQAPIHVDFSTYGVPKLRPFDIIEVVFPDQSDNAYYGLFNPAGGHTETLAGSLKMRVMTVSANIDMTSEMKYSMRINAVHK